VRYRFIQQHQGQFPTAALCRAMQVSRNGFYAWRDRPPSQRANQDAALVEHIRAAHQESRQTYGSPRLYHELREQGFRCGRHRVARLMRESSLSARVPKRFVATTDSHHGLPVAQNLMGRGFSARKADTKWSGDITYVPTAQGWLYLAVVLDLFSRRVIGWAMRETLERELAVAALSGALAVRDPRPGLLCHSDRGSQYASGDYQDALAAAGAICSMSRTGNCWDNAPIESFFASLKCELVHRRRFATRQEARTAIFEWIEAWYNRKRRHSALGYLSPEEFERRHRQHHAVAA
jgi:transposase InsO family protein